MGGNYAYGVTGFSIGIGRQQLFRVVDLGVGEPFEPPHLGEGQFGEEAQKSADIGVARTSQAVSRRRRWPAHGVPVA